MAKCPNCLEANFDNHYQGYCDECYEEIYLDYGADPDKGIFEDEE